MRLPIKRHQIVVAAAAILGVLALGSFVQMRRDTPDVKASQLVPDNWKQQDAPAGLSWPSQGSAAVSVGGVGLIDSTANDRPRAIASLVKVMTAYVVLKDHPLKQGEQGAAVQVQAADVQLYRQQLANGESVVAVKEGDNISELQLLQGLLVPSGNNYAYMLANWNSGSVEAFVQRMNDEAKALGMTDSRYTDPSGVSPASVSTARDQLKLAEAAMADPTFAAVVGLKQAELPAVGVVYNVNSQLGQPNLAGIKTGWTDEAGACYLVAINWQSGDTRTTIFSAVLGQDTLVDAYAATSRLVNSARDGLQVVSILNRGTVVAALSNDWGGQTTAVPAADVTFILWPGLAVATKLQPALTGSTVRRGAEVGKVVVTAGAQHREVTLLAQEKLTSAPLSWRLTRLK